MHNNNKKYKAFSLLEILITLVIVSIVMVMLSNVLFMTLDVSRKIYARSVVREEQNNLLTKLEKDIRNARLIKDCSGEDANARCVIHLQYEYIWQGCMDQTTKNLSVCKISKDGEILEQTSENIKVDNFRIEQGIVDSEGKKTIIVTLVVSHVDDQLGINNQTRQLVISTRNFGF